MLVALLNWPKELIFRLSAFKRQPWEVADVARGRVVPPNRKSSTCSMNPEPGEIWLADLGLAAKTRPVIIVSRYDPDPSRSFVSYVPLTTQRRSTEYSNPPAC